MNKNLSAKTHIVKTVCCMVTLGIILTFGVENAVALSHSNSYKSLPDSHSKSKAFGLTLTQWMLLHQAWFLQGQDPQTGTIGRVKLLPLPQQEPTPVPPVPIGSFSTGNLDLTLKSGTPLVVPVMILNGEAYVNNLVPPDEPIDLFKNSLLSSDIKVELDGKTLLQSPEANQKYFYGPAFFPEPVTYQPPQLRFSDPVLGEVFAASAIWSEGIGFVYPPLKVGKHVLHIFAVNNDLGFGFDNTWNITVLPGKGK
jgi:hypothetical protein